MAQPYDYSINAQNPVQSFMQGFQSMAAIDTAAAQQKAAQQQAAQQAQMQKDFGEVYQSPSSEGIAKLSIKYPQMSEQIKRTYDMFSTEKQKSTLNQVSQVYSALSGGNVELAKQLANEQLTAYKNSGDTQNAQQADTLLKMIDANPKAALTSAGMFLSSAMGPEKFTESFAKIQEEKRKEEMQPGELKKQGAALGLTEAETNKTLVETKKLGLENQKLLMDLESAKKSGGLIDPNKKFDYEKDLRKEYATQTGDFQTVRSSYQRVLQSEDTPAGDIALIFNYMKMLDPGSVVREGEFATAQNAGGIPDRILNAYNKALNGERLNPDQRKMFSNQAKSLYTGAETREKEVRKGLQRVVKSYGLDESNVFYSEGETPTPTKQGAAPATTLPTGWKVTKR